MHRRHLLATALVAMAPRSPRPDPVGAAPSWAFRAFAGPAMTARDELATLNAKVWSFGNEIEAAAAFAAAAEHIAPPPQPPGEIEMHVVDVRVTTSIPGLDLPARLLVWTIVAGAAAVETSYGIVIIRRDQFFWGLFAQSGQGSESFTGVGDILSALADRLVDRRIRRQEVTNDDDGLYRGGLWDLLPDEADVPAGMTLEDQRTGEALDDPGTLIATRIDQRKAA